MLKRNISVVIAGILLGAHFGMAAAGNDFVAASAQSNRENSAPHVQTTYQAQHANRTSAASNDAFPASAQSNREKSMPHAQTM